MTEPSGARPAAMVPSGAGDAPREVLPATELQTPSEAQPAVEATPGDPALERGAPDAGTLAPSSTETGSAALNDSELPETPASIVWGECPSSETGQSDGKLTSPEINEASGLAASRHSPGTYWVHNDSGDSARLFAIDLQGTHLGTVAIEGAQASDWEDMSVGPGPDGSTPHFYIADIGDNSMGRDSVQIYRAPEPALMQPASGEPVQHTVTAERFDVRYPDGPRDAEAFFLDPVSGAAYLITKTLLPPAELYRISLPERGTDSLLWEKVGEVNVLLATAADMDPSGSLIAIRTYTSIRLWPRLPSESVADSLARVGCGAASQAEGQGETVAFGLQSDRYVTVSEGQGPTVWQFEISPDL